MKIALAGNIASGKSTVQKILHDLGYKVLDTDACGHDALKQPDVKKAFSDLDIFENGEISRPKFGRLVFKEPEIKQKLETIVHPIIRQEILDFFEQNKTDKLLFVGIPLVFEAKMENLFDKIIFIYADDKIRLKRLINRNNYTEEYALLRINSQLPQEEKLARCDYVIKNNDTVDELKKLVTDLVSKLH